MPAPITPKAFCCHVLLALHENSADLVLLGFVACVGHRRDSDVNGLTLPALELTSEDMMRII